ncbi:MAG: ABC transporter permease [Acidobacteria bacterium]|nr:ABC transporter permease [Acidobacteriota bacterium]
MASRNPRTQKPEISLTIELGIIEVRYNWFQLQNENPLLGRTFAPEEDQPGRSHVVVLDHGFWLRHFAADPNILGRTMILDKAPWQIIGVMQPGFQVYGVTSPDIYTPYVMQEHPGTGVYVAGRLKPGIRLLLSVVLRIVLLQVVTVDTTNGKRILHGQHLVYARP